MNISTLRQTLRDWLSTLVRIDSFSLDVPRDLSSPLSTVLLPLPGNTLREYPAEKIAYKKTNFNSIEGSAIFPFSLIYRYPGYLEYKNLPIARLESLSEYIQGHALLGFGDCNIRAIEIDPTEASVNPQRLGGLIREPVDPTREAIDQNEYDWIIYVNFSFNITYAFTLFVLPTEFGTDPNVAIPGSYPTDLKIYDAGTPLNIDTAKLDSEHILVQNP